jgi:alcohol dehydrogenase class IV
MSKQFEFDIASIPQIIFGSGRLSELSRLIPLYGTNVLFVIGERSLRKSRKWNEITDLMEQMEINYSYASVSQEPSPSIIDTYAAKYREKPLDLIISIGGGSVMDAGKAISAMIPHQDSIKNYLEGVGTKKPDGQKIPFIAIPSTSGTGSEATKNAVISQIGENGFKKSLRHENYIPDVAIVDPELTLSCPPSITAACAMDAFTQLYGSYVSSKANPMTDELAYSGMKYMKDNIVPACTDAQHNIEVRTALAYGSLISGITLANAGLGIVHGFASSIGGFFDIPHGVVCGTLLAEAVRINVKRLWEMGPRGKPSLKKHAKIGALFANKKDFRDEEISHYIDILTETLEKWTEKLNLKRLGSYGISEEEIDQIIKNTSLKNNPVELSPEDIEKILKNRL